MGAHLLWVQEVASSNLASPTDLSRDDAQLLQAREKSGLLLARPARTAADVGLVMEEKANRSRTARRDTPRGPRRVPEEPRRTIRAPRWHSGFAAAVLSVWGRRLATQVWHRPRTCRRPGHRPPPNRPRWRDRGRGLAAGLGLLARDRAEDPAAFQLLIYPMIDEASQNPPAAGTSRSGSPRTTSSAGGPTSVRRMAATSRRTLLRVAPLTSPSTAHLAHCGSARPVRRRNEHLRAARQSCRHANGSARL